MYHFLDLSDVSSCLNSEHFLARIPVGDAVYFITHHILGGMMIGGKAKLEHFVYGVMKIRCQPLHKMRATRLSTWRFLTPAESAVLGTLSSRFITQIYFSVS